MPSPLKIEILSSSPPFFKFGRRLNPPQLLDQLLTEFIVLNILDRIKKVLIERCQLKWMSEHIQQDDPTNFADKIKCCTFKEKILHQCTQNLDDMTYSSWNIECARLKLLILGHFLPFYPPKNKKKTQFLKNEKKCWRYHHFTHVYQKPESHEVRFLRFGVRQTELFVI